MNRTEGTRIRDLLVGQEDLLARLDRALAEDRVAHAYLVLGPRGVGKLRTALAFAQQLLCTSDGPPCGSCAGCRRTARLIHADLHVIIPVPRGDVEESARLLESYAADPFARIPSPANVSIGIDRVRALKEEVAKSLVEGNRRVVLLAGAGRMTEQAAQAALKLVEEPPPRTVLILTAEDPAQLLPTLVSRCQRLAVRPLPRDVLSGLLEEGLETEPTEARLLAPLSGGSLGRALEMREDRILELRDRVLRLFDLPPSGPAPAEVERRVGAVERAWNADTARRAAELLLIWYRDLIVARSGADASLLANADRAVEAAREAARLPVEEIGRRMRIVEDMVRAVEQNVNPALALSTALLRTGSPEEDVLPNR